MNNVSLYRKYQPLYFKNILGQDEIVTSLKNSLSSNKFTHAYIFAGPRGTGKTSLAKIFARSLNCENLTPNQETCKKCKVCLENFSSGILDIIEIDGASNNGVDEMRDLKSKLQMLPNISKYKVYIIDEVHMLSTAAFNALLKTLEEPPKHVIFILATTEINKIPLTILSRCQRFNFSLLSEDIIIKNMKKILDSEKIKYEIDALKEIAQLAEGSIRDSLSILEQVITYKNDYIKLDNVLKSLKLLNNNDIINFINSFIELDEIKILEIKSKIIKNGIDINYFLISLLKIIKIKLEKLIFFQKDLKNESLFELFQLIINYNNYLYNIKDPILHFELFILDLIGKINAKNHHKNNKKPKSIIKINNNNLNIKNNSDLIVSNSNETNNNIKSESIAKTLKLNLSEIKKNIIANNDFNDDKFNAKIDNNYFLALLKHDDENLRNNFIKLIKEKTDKDFLYFYNSNKFPRVNNNGIIIVFNEKSDANYLNYALFNKKTRKIILEKLNLKKICIIALNNNEYLNLINNISILKLEKSKLNINDYYDNLYPSDLKTKKDQLKELFGDNIKIIKELT